MALDIPDSPQKLVDRSKADVQRELKKSNPFGKNHWISAITVAADLRIYDFYLDLKEAIKQSFPDSATGDFLTRFAAIWRITANVETKSSGNVVATGTVSSIIPAGTALSVASTGIFTVTSDVNISAQSINISSLTRSGTTVTATTVSDHNLANDISCTMTNAANSEYNVIADITVIDSNEFQYEIVGSPPDELTTSAVASFVSASVPVESDEFGSDYNLDAGTKLSLQSPLSGVDDTLTADFYAVTGGADTESPDSVKSRMLYRIQNPIANFNVAAIEDQCKQIAGVTRVFVNEVTPDLGQTTIYFMRDNDVDPIPSAGEVNIVKSKILEIKPVDIATDDVIVASPTAVYVDFVFTDIDPATSTMKSAIDNNLKQFFAESTSEGQNIDQDAYRAAIFNTVDLVTGDVVNTFTLSSPSGDIAIAAGEIGQLGNVTYP